MPRKKDPATKRRRQPTSIRFAPETQSQLRKLAKERKMSINRTICFLVDATMSRLQAAEERGKA